MAVRSRSQSSSENLHPSERKRQGTTITNFGAANLIDCALEDDDDEIRVHEEARFDQRTRIYALYVCASMQSITPVHTQRVI